MPTYLMPMARCITTGQTVKSNDLGQKFAITQQRDADLQAQTLAHQMISKTGREWQPVVQQFTTLDDGRTRL